jgi:rod shape-determining protein MreC
VSPLSAGKKLVLLGVLVAVMLLGLHFSAGSLDRLTPLESATRDFLAPVQRLLMIAGREVAGFFSYPVKLINVSRRNEILEGRVEELEGKLLKYKEVQAENVRLKKLLDFQTGVASQMNTEAAAVIGRDTGNWFGSIIINAGSKKGIRRDMAVITPAGLVGRVIRVSDSTAEVLLITDPRSGVGCLVQETRAPGIVEGVAGGRGNLQMVHIPNDLPTEKGDIIITSGLGSVFPKGIPVGTVRETRKEKSGLFKMAVVDPYVDFNRLEEVLVIKSFHPGGR